MLTLMLLGHNRKSTFLNVEKSYARSQPNNVRSFSSHRLSMVLVAKVYENNLSCMVLFQEDMYQASVSVYSRIFSKFQCSFLVI